MYRWARRCSSSWTRGIIRSRADSSPLLQATSISVTSCVEGTLIAFPPGEDHVTNSLHYIIWVSQLSSPATIAATAEVAGVRPRAYPTGVHPGSTYFRRAPPFEPILTLQPHHPPSRPPPSKPRPSPRPDTLHPNTS